MDNMRRSVKEDRLSFSDAGPDPIPVTCKASFILGRGKINYHLIDLGEADWDRLSGITGECGYVESACWIPQEKFSDYLRRCDLLCYAEQGGSIIGFTAVSMMFGRNMCLYSNDETMVLKEFRNMKVALSLVMLPLEWLFARTGRLEGTPHFVFTSISANPRVVNFYFKNAWSRIFFDCSFKPSLSLMAIKNDYCRKHRIGLVHEDYPFCLKNLFPGSNKFGRSDPKFQFSHQVKANMPPEFDHMERGDAFAFMLKLPTKATRVVTRILMLRCFGKDYLASREIGPFRAKMRAVSANAGRHPGKPVEMVSRVGMVHPRNHGSRGDAFSRVSPRNGSAASQDMD